MNASKMTGAAIALLGLGMLTGCGSGITRYQPQLRAYGELTLRYDDGFAMTAEGREVASGVGWGGLSEYVKCVPRALEHAESAESSGSAALGLTWSGAGIGLASLGSLGGLAVYDKDPDLAAGILGVGVAAAVTGVVLAAIGRNMKNVANGHAVDAMNYYNDEVGSWGGTCKQPAPKPPSAEVEAAAPGAVPERKGDPDNSGDDDGKAVPPPPPPPSSGDDI